jgi:Na+-transporting methylmalonyl-CoA/oxaloacetate decarboxylase gamma subunit
VTVAENFAIGLNITLLGMALVFSALILVAIVIWLLDRVFRPRGGASVAPIAAAAPAVKRPPAPAPELRPPAARGVMDKAAAAEAEAAAMAAAIAVVAAKQASLPDEAVAIATAIVQERRRARGAKDPFARARMADEQDKQVEGEIVYVATIEPGPGTWRYQGRLHALQ